MGTNYKFVNTSEFNAQIAALTTQNPISRSTEIEQLNITENGSYEEEGKAYSPVIANVPQTAVAELNATENRTYTAEEGHAYNPVNVSIISDTAGKLVSDTLTSITATDLAGATKIRGYCFSRSTITSIELPSTVTEVEMNAFERCYDLASITIPNGVTKIGNYAFTIAGACPLRFPGSVTSFGTYIIQSSNVPSLVFDEGITSTGDYSFQSCTHLTLVDLPSTMTSIGLNAFAGSSSLMTIICRATTPPTIQTNSLTSVPATCLIYVPDDSVDTYKGATNWSARADYIKPLSQYNP